MPGRAVLLSLCLLGSVVAASLVTENSAPDASLCGSFPKLYKEIIWNWMQSTLVDANSAKIEWGEEPRPADVGGNGTHLYGWLVRFKVNARNRFGLYTGKQAHAALIRDGRVAQAFGFGY